MSPYRIAVCEDDRCDRELLTSLLQTLNSSSRLEVSCYESADALRSSLEGGTPPFDLYLLDIQLPGASGLELGRWLYAQGVRNRVVFVTVSAEYALEGYDAHPLHYLLKPIGREALAAALSLAQESARPQTAQFRCGRRTVSLPLDDIRYMESRDHGVVVFLGEQTRPFPQSLTEAERSLPVEMFARCHKSYLVNLSWVEECGRGGVVLRDGVRLPVSRTFYRSFQSALVRWLNRSAG